MLNKKIYPGPNKKTKTTSGIVCFFVNDTDYPNKPDNFLLLRIPVFEDKKQVSILF